jgi:hypothetical protein
MDWSHGSNQDPEEREPMTPTPDMGHHSFWEEYNHLRDLRTRELLANYYKQECQLESRILEEMAATVDRKLEKLQSDRDQFRRDQREFEKGCESIRQLQRKLQTDCNSLQQREGEEPLPPALISASTSRLSLGRTKKGEIVFGGVDRRGKVYRRIQKPLSPGSAISHDKIIYWLHLANMTKEEVDGAIRRQAQRR